MRVFKEKQGFRQWWMLLIGISCLAITLVLLIDDFLESKTSLISKESTLALLCLIFLIILFNLSLHTRIDQRGIKTWWEPFHFLEKEFLWKDLQKISVRKYKPVQEYGGWGIRGHGKTKAYNVSGNQGIQLVNSKGRFLIGTQKSNEAQLVIKRYRL
ncbi:hypothetical protein DET49_107163 [Salegentibacter sp. 24]|uniref:hypothetical protein n=1 Tax=Salegentibacter sp. 24 TaxID=2183986 RepID=UPI00105CF156|nr:hypothetical protein [Salegentibacter sp. 24]TDN89241.1 hypothetical protein DET49_107163 [Salegentibacter sp. 24]